MGDNMMIEAKSHTDYEGASVGETFLKSLSLLEQVHRRLHDVVKDDLERSGERSLTGVQALLLYEIGDGETPASALRARGAFAGTSMSYNVKKLQEGGYLVQTRSSDDRRTVRLKLTAAGQEVRKQVAALADSTPFRKRFQVEPSCSSQSLRTNDFCFWQNGRNTSATTFESQKSWQDFCDDF